MPMRAEDHQARRRRWARSLLVAHLGLYAPFAWLVLMPYPWNDYHWFWLRLWPLLPGFVAGLLIRPASDAATFLVMSVAATAQLVLFAWLGSRGRVALIVSGSIALALATFNSLVARAAFLM